MCRAHQRILTRRYSVREKLGPCRRLRPVGSALSPNGAAFNPEGMLSLGLLDKVEPKP